jgi:hypothetical protein
MLVDATTRRTFMKRSVLATTLAAALISCAVFAQQTIGPGDSVPVGPGGRTLSGSGAATGVTATTQPVKSSTSKPGKLLKYAVPSEQQVAIAKQTIKSLAERAQTVSSLSTGMHMIESPHFTIYSWFPPAQDKSIRESMEQLYTMLSLPRAFDVSKDETVWVGKCGVFMLDNQERFTDFVTQVDRIDPHMALAAGYCRYCSNWAYLVLNMPTSKGDVEGYKLTLMHEGTHAFLSRYVSDRRIPTWLNEGIADAMADSQVPSSRLKARLKDATREALKGQMDAKKVFDGVRLGQFDYGIAQSWVQFLLATNRKGFLKFLTLIKQGKSEADALQECYKWDRDQMYQAWRTAAARSLR